VPRSGKEKRLFGVSVTKLFKSKQSFGQKKFARSNCQASVILAGKAIEWASLSCLVELTHTNKTNLKKLVSNTLAYFAKVSQIKKKVFPNL